MGILFGRLRSYACLLSHVPRLVPGVRFLPQAQQLVHPACALHRGLALVTRPLDLLCALDSGGGNNNGGGAVHDGDHGEDGRRLQRRRQVRRRLLLGVRDRGRLVQTKGLAALAVGRERRRETACADQRARCGCCWA